jgi:hypothetical protein
MRKPRAFRLALHGIAMGSRAVIALYVSPRGFTALELARQVRLLSNQAESDDGSWAWPPKHRQLFFRSLCQAAKATSALRCFLGYF